MGDEVIISYVGIVVLFSEYMDDMLLVNEDVLVMVNIFVNEMDSIIINKFIMDFLFGEFCMFMFIIIDKVFFDLLIVVIFGELVNGIVIVNDDGIVMYVLNIDFFGEDLFIYIVCVEGIIDENEELVEGEIVGEGIVIVVVVGV